MVSSKLIDLSNATHREYLPMMEYKGQAIFRDIPQYVRDYPNSKIASKINRNELV